MKEPKYEKITIYEYFCDVCGVGLKQEKTSDSWISGYKDEEYVGGYMFHSNCLMEHLNKTLPMDLEVKPLPKPIPWWKRLFNNF